METATSQSTLTEQLRSFLIALAVPDGMSRRAPLPLPRSKSRRRGHRSTSSLRVKPTVAPTGGQVPVTPGWKEVKPITRGGLRPDHEQPTWRRRAQSLSSFESLCLRHKIMATCGIFFFFFFLNPFAFSPLRLLSINASGKRGAAGDVRQAPPEPAPKQPRPAVFANTAISSFVDVESTLEGVPGRSASFWICLIATCVRDDRH